MAFTGHLTKLVWGGNLFNTEIWSCSLHLSGPDTPGAGASLSYAPALTAWMGRANSFVNNKAHLQYCKANEVDPITQRQVDLGQTDEHNFTPEVDSATSYVEFPQLSLCVSLMTAASRGRASKGRYYPPTALAPGDLDTTNGVISTVAASYCATSNAQLIADLNAIGTAKVIVFSHIGQVGREVTGIRVGRVMDTIRSRRSALAEQYEVAPLP